MTPEATLWKLFRGHLPRGAHAQRVETGGTGLGIPDINICCGGREIWVELKIVSGKQVRLSPEQVAWHFRRTNAGGQTYVVARNKFDGVRKGKGDEIYVWPGSCAIAVQENGIQAEGGQMFTAPFDWDKIMQLIF
tara:strand:+ start:219 stop:623 length:405 start_codon:yes stop_codon:yes gene_type:complete